MILKMDTFLRDLPQLRERENLKTAAIGQDRPAPVHKPMQPAKVPNDLHPRPNEKVVGVAENDLGLEFAQFAGAHAFHTPLSPDWHEGRRLDHAMRGRQATAARLTA